MDSPEREVLLSDGPSPAITPITPPTSVITPRLGLPHDDMFTHSSFDEVTTLTHVSFTLQRSCDWPPCERAALLVI